MADAPGDFTVRGAPRPSVLSRLAAAVKREVPIVHLQAFERAGSAVFELDLLVDERRRELSAAGVHPWEADSSTASLFLAAWVARVHQTLGTELLASDRALDPRTAGYVPPVTYQQAWAFFQPVAFWMTAARRALATPDYWIGDHTELPVSLPSVFRSGAPHKNVKGLLMAGDAVDQLMEQALGAVLACGDPPARWASQCHRLHELAAQSRSALHYAQALWHPDADTDLDGIIVRHLQPALVLEHHLGQFLALPELVDQYRNEARPRRRRAGNG